jgi:ubiquitin carboxyl-terminal hydrolase 10
MLLEELPPVLVLQLKWFIYDKSGGIQKYVKQVDFDVDLEIGKGC